MKLFCSTELNSNNEAVCHINSNNEVVTLAVYAIWVIQTKVLTATSMANTLAVLKLIGRNWVCELNFRMRNP